MKLLRLSLSLAVLGTAACSIHTDLPEPPKAGSIGGTLDTGGHLPPENQVITLTSDKGERRTQPTGPGGVFTFADLPPGLYLASVTLPGFAKWSSDLLRVNSGDAVDLGLIKPDWLQSTPQEATLHGKVSAMNGGSVEGAKVEFRLLGGGPVGGVVVAQVVVSEDGLFSQRLPPGDFKVVASHPFFESAEAMVTLQPAQEKDATGDPLLLKIKPATLKGQVFMERDGLDPVPATGARVTVLGTAGGADVDVAGNFEATGLPGGDYQVQITFPDFHDSVPSRPVTLVPLMDTTLPKVTLLIDRTTVVGKVKISDNGPVSGARVELAGSTGYSALVTPDSADPSEGSFTIANVPAAKTWTVTASKDQYASASTSVVTVVGVPSNAGTLRLTRLFGDFLIDDNDSANTPGYTRRLDVTLNFTGFPATDVDSWRASEDPNFADGGQPFLAYTGRLQPFGLDGGDGVHTVFAQYKNGAQATSQTFTSNVVLDTVAPPAPQVAFSFTGSSGAAHFVNKNQNLALTVVGDDGMGSGLSLMRVGEALDAGAVPDPVQLYRRDTTLVRSATTDGLVRGFVQIIDHAGNVSVVGSDQITVDTVAPTGSITLVRGAKATDDGFTNNPLVTVNETWADDGGVVLIKFANGLSDLGTAIYQPVSPSAAWFIDPNGDGLKHVYVNFRDVAGNEMAMPGAFADDETITYDTHAPNPAQATLQTPAITKNPQVTMSFATNVADLSSTQALTLSDEATFTSSSTVGPSVYPMSNQANFTLPAGDGVRSVYVRLRDKAGNDALTSVSLTLDTRPPEGSFTITGALADGTPSSTITSSGTVTVGLVAGGAVEYRLGDSSVMTCPATGYTTITTTTLTGVALPGDGKLTLCLRDAAGNVQGPILQGIAFDAAAPTSCALALAGRKVDGSPAPAGLTANTSVTATISTCSEVPTELVLSNTPVTCSPSTVLPWQPYVTTLQQLVPTGDVQKTVYGCVRDAARNVGTITAAQITLDTTAPTPVSVTIVQPSPVNVRPITLTLSASDTNGLGTTDAVTASEDPLFVGSTTIGPQAYPAGNTLPFTLSAGDADKTVRVRFRDRVGNDSFATAFITYDGTPPTGSFVIQGTLADLTPSTSVTTTNSVVIQLTQTGATGYLLDNETRTTCPASAASYTAITTNSIAHTMTSTASPRQVRLCLRDASGNLSGAAPIAGSIPFDATPPASCVFALTGQGLNGVTPPGGKTATTNVTVTTTTPCTEATDIYFSTSAIVCSATASLPYVSYAASLVTGLAGPDGPNQLWVCVRDAARNVATFTTPSIVLDRLGPTSPNVFINGNAAWATSLTGNTISGGAIGAVAWQVSQDNTAFPAYGALGPLTNFTLQGTGTQTVYARFRDDVGNESAIANDTIQVDTAPPDIAGAGTLWAFDTPTGAAVGFTNSTNLSFTFRFLPADAVGIQIVQAASCTPGAFTGATIIPASTSIAFSLGAVSDGVFPLCARVLDAAGNASAALSPQTVTLDRLPPTAPSITTSPALLNASSPAAFTVNTAGAVTELNFARYETSGGTSSTWNNNGGSDLLIGSSVFSYTLQQNKANVLRLRAVDKAGNVSPEDSVTITWDATRPGRVTMRDFWVDNSDGHSTVYWVNPLDTDIVAYKVYYGPTPGSTNAGGLPINFNGSNAIEGSSPVTVPAIPGALDQSLALTGLTNGSVVFATVTALDAAGNESQVPNTSPQLLSFYVTLEPNEVSMNRIARIPVTGAGVIEAISIQGDRAYIAGRTNPNCSSTGSVTLTVVDLSQMSSAIRQGHPDSAPPQPSVIYGPITFADAIGCTVNSPTRPLLVDILADGPFLYLSSANNVRVFSLTNPDAPFFLSQASLAYQTQQLHLVGDRLFTTGDPTVVALRVSDLYDANVSTAVTVADQIGAANPNIASPWWPSGSTVTRNRLIEYTYNGGTSYDFLLNQALAAVPTFTTAGASIAVTGNGLDYFTEMESAATGGNYLYYSTPLTFTIYRLANLWNSTTAGPGLNAGGTADQYRQIQTSGGLGTTVAGNQAFLVGNAGSLVTSVDMFLATGMNEASLNIVSNQRAVATYGNFMITGSSTTPNASLTFWELATPRSMHEIASGAGGGPFVDVRPGFAISGNGRAHDLHTGANIPTPGSISFPSSYDDFLYDSTLMGETLVTAQGSGFILINVSDATDRTTGTVFDVSDATTVNHPIANARVTGVEAWGNYLVAATIRTDGLWIELYDGRLARNPAAGTFAGALLFSARLANFVPTNTVWASISLRNGRAIIGLDDSVGSAPSPGVYIVDFRTLVDDLAGGSFTILGTLPLTQVRQTQVRGGWLYAGGNNALNIIDIKETMTEPPTSLPGSPLSTTVTGSVDALAVYGNHAFVIGRNGGQLRSIDVRVPLSPVVMSVLPIASSYYVGSSPIEPYVNKPYRRGLAVAGTRLYETGFDEIRVIELE